MKAVSLLQVSYSFFLGMVVLGLVAIGINTFHPTPQWPQPAAGSEGLSQAEIDAALAAQDQWVLSTSLILLICAAVILVISLWLPYRMAVISSGLLLGGVFTMIYAASMLSSTAAGQLNRFLVAVATVIITIVLGYLTLVRRSSTPAPAPGGADESAQSALSYRVTVLESRLDALGRAMHG